MDKLVSISKLVDAKANLTPINIIGNTRGMPNTANKVALTPSDLDKAETNVNTTENPYDTSSKVKKKLVESTKGLKLKNMSNSQVTSAKERIKTKL